MHLCFVLFQRLHSSIFGLVKYVVYGIKMNHCTVLIFMTAMIFTGKMTCSWRVNFHLLSILFVIYVIVVLTRSVFLLSIYCLFLLDALFLYILNIFLLSYLLSIQFPSFSFLSVIYHLFNPILFYQRRGGTFQSVGE